MDLNSIQMIKDFITIIFTWPFVTIVAILCLRKPIVKLVNRLVDSEHGKAKIPGIEIELGKLTEKSKSAITDMEELNYLMAKSRLLELEITYKQFGLILSDSEKEEMNHHIEQFNQIIENHTCPTKVSS